MANDGFNASTLTFAAVAVGNGIRGIRVNDSAADVDVTGASDTEGVSESGVPKKEVTFDFVGTTTIGSGDKGAIAITWNDGTSGGGITNAVCLSVQYGGNMDGELSGSATFKPSTAP